MILNFYFHLKYIMCMYSNMSCALLVYRLVYQMWMSVRHKILFATTRQCATTQMGRMSVFAQQDLQATAKHALRQVRLACYSFLVVNTSPQTSGSSSIYFKCNKSDPYVVSLCIVFFKKKVQMGGHSFCR